MAFDQEQKAALRILEGIEEGTMSAADSLALVEEADPALVYQIFTWLRQRDGPDDAASDAVMSRLLAISHRPSIAKQVKEGQSDPVVEWFEDAYSYRKLGSKEFIQLVVEKLEG